MATDKKNTNPVSTHIEQTSKETNVLEAPMPDTDNTDTFGALQARLASINEKRTEALQTEMEAIFKAGMEATWLGSGWGSYNEQIHNNFSKFDRFRTRFVMDNYLRTGFLFMTRPMLNLQFSNLQMNRTMNLLNTMNPKSIQFAIRSYLDTRFARLHPVLVAQCPFIDYRSPFMTIITNNVTDFSGGPSYQMNVETEEPGYFSESQSVAIGSDSFKRPFDIQLSVVDPIGGPIDAIMRFWTLYMELINTGEMIMYPDQVHERVLNYTVSFYRFIMDPSMTYIRKMAKYTGCFPVSHPGASVFDFSSKQTFVDTLRNYSLTFKCGSGHVDVDDPVIAEEFDILVERYFPKIRCLRPNLVSSSGGRDTLDRTLCSTDLRKVDEVLNNNGLVRNPIIPEFNYCGVPYIVDTPSGLRLDVISEAEELPFNKHLFKNMPTMKFQLRNLNESGIPGVTADNLIMKDASGQATGLIEMSSVDLLEAAADQVTKAIEKYDKEEDQLISSYLAQRQQSLLQDRQITKTETLGNKLTTI